MPTELNKYVPLKTIVSYVLDELNSGIGDFDKLWVLALRGLIDLHQDIACQPETIRIPVSGNKTCPFPSNYLSWTKIGILNSAGEISTLRINTGLTTYRDANPNRIEQLTPDINDSVQGMLFAPYYFNYYFNGTYSNLFGVGGGLIQYGECVVDEANEVVVLSPHFKYDAIMFEYLTVPADENGEYRVPLPLQEAVIAFVKWKLKQGTAVDYYAEATKGRRRLPKKKVTLQMVNQILRESEAQKLRS